MDPKSSAVLERLVRSLTMLIPYIGSPVEQLTFGIKESFANIELIDRLKAIEEELKKLQVQQESQGNYLADLRVNDNFNAAKSLIFERLNAKNVLVKYEESPAKILPLLNENLKLLRHVEGQIETIKLEREEFLHTLNEVILALNKLKANRAGQQVVLTLKRKTARTIADTLKMMGRALQISTAQDLNLQISPIQFANFLDFPVGEIRDESLLDNYYISAFKIPYFILETDLNEIATIATRLRSYSFESSNRGNSTSQKVLKKINAFYQHLEKAKSEIPREVSISEDLKAKMTSACKTVYGWLMSKGEEFQRTRSTAIYNDVARYLIVHEMALGDQSILFPFSVKMEEMIYEYLRDEQPIHKNNKKIFVVNCATAAMAMFFVGYHYTPHDLEYVYHLYERFKFDTTEFTFDTEDQLFEFRKEIEHFKNIFTSFKVKVKEKAIDDLTDVKQTIESINRAFTEFYEAFGEIDDQVKHAIDTIQSGYKFE